MRILFLSGVSVGGAARSTVMLAELLRERGHATTVLLGDRSEAPAVFDIGLRAAIKRRGGPDGKLLRSLIRRMGRTAAPVDPARSWVLRTPLSENAFVDVLRGTPADVVVANSFPREQMRWIHDDLQRLNVPMCIYVRESHAVTHFSVSGLRPELVIANSATYAKQVAAHTRCVMLPSVIDYAAATVESTRSTVLLVNPVADNHLDLVLGAANLCRDVPFAFQESWPLSPADRRGLEEEVSCHPNVELRPVADSPAEIYRDARVLVATYPSGRPRVIAEAQHNGIPVLALAYPGLVEATGPAGVILPVDASAEDLAAEIGRLWDDDEQYRELVGQSFNFSRRTEVDPQEIVKRFEAEIEPVVNAYQS